MNTLRFIKQMSIRPTRHRPAPHEERESRWEGHTRGNGAIASGAKVSVLGAARPGPWTDSHVLGTHMGLMSRRRPRGAPRLRSSAPRPRHAQLARRSTGAGTGCRRADAPRCRSGTPRNALKPLKRSEMPWTLGAAVLGGKRADRNASSSIDRAGRKKKKRCLPYGSRSASPTANWLLI